MVARKRVTIKQVAQEAGVSTQTVSRVINERPDVAPATRQRILDVIDQLGYRPSALARSLIQQRTYTLGVVTAGLKFLGPSRTLNGIADKAEEMGYTLIVKEMPSFNASEVLPIIDSLLARQVDGILWAVAEVGDNHAEFHALTPAAAIPVMFLTVEERSNWHSVSIDNYVGGCLATEHLLAQGYRRIGHVSGPLDWWEARQRKKGWRDVLTAAGVPPPSLHAAEGNWSSESGERAIYRLLDQYPDMDAVFVANDQMALAALSVAHRRGLRVPADLGVVGFDGTPESAYFWPALTTIDQDQHRLGCTAVRELVRIVELARSNQVALQPTAVALEPQLIVRQSSQRF